MDLELNSEGGSGGATSVCSDQLFDGCRAEPVLDLSNICLITSAQANLQASQRVEDNTQGVDPLSYCTTTRTSCLARRLSRT